MKSRPNFFVFYKELCHYFSSLKYMEKMQWSFMDWWRDLALLGNHSYLFYFHFSFPYYFPPVFFKLAPINYSLFCSFRLSEGWFSGSLILDQSLQLHWSRITAFRLEPDQRWSKINYCVLRSSEVGPWSSNLSLTETSQHWWVLLTFTDGAAENIAIAATFYCYY